MKCCEVTDGFGDKIKLVQLRNPWGSFEWLGTWSDGDEENWTDDIRKQCGYEDAEGLFWMSFEDACTYFSRFQICELNDDYQHSFMKASHKKGSYSLMRLVVGGEGEHTVSVSQVDERCFNRHSEYDYSYCRMILAKVEKDSDELKDLELKYVTAQSGQEREVHI